MVGKDLIMQTLLGGGSSGESGGGSSGGGGGAVAVSPKEVNFYDYDGTCVHAYTVAEAQKLSALPDSPEHDGLVFQGWNWSLEGVNGLTRAMNIGAMYTTDDGTTRLYITLQEGRTSPMLGVGVNGTVTVDWGDGTEPDVLTGTSTSTTKWTQNHAYAKPGDYVIRLTVDGNMVFVGDGMSETYASILRHASSADSRNQAYQSAIKRVEIADNVKSIGNYAFYNCSSLAYLTIPDSVTGIGGNAFRYCSSLAYLTIPDNVTSIGDSAFRSCSSLSLLTIPKSVTKFETYAFRECRSLSLLTIPDNVTSVSSMFYSCPSLSFLVIPGGVSDITSSAFYSCGSMAVCDFTACTIVPTLANINAFTDIPDDCEIRVPAALYDEWIAATNWATYANQIKAY